MLDLPIVGSRKNDAEIAARNARSGATETSMPTHSSVFVLPLRRFAAPLSSDSEARDRLASAANRLELAGSAS